MNLVTEIIILLMKILVHYVGFKVGSGKMCIHHYTYFTPNKAINKIIYDNGFELLTIVNINCQQRLIS